MIRPCLSTRRHASCELDTYRMEEVIRAAHHIDAHQRHSSHAIFMTVLRHVQGGKQRRHHFRSMQREKQSAGKTKKSARGGWRDDSERRQKPRAGLGALRAIAAATGSQRQLGGVLPPSADLRSLLPCPRSRRRLQLGHQEPWAGGLWLQVDAALRPHLGGRVLHRLVVIHGRGAAAAAPTNSTP